MILSHRKSIFPVFWIFRKDPGLTFILLKMDRKKTCTKVQVCNMKDEQDIIRQSEEMTDTRQPSFGVVILGDSVESRLVEKRNRRR